MLSDLVELFELARDFGSKFFFLLVEARRAQLQCLNLSFVFLQLLLLLFNHLILIQVCLFLLNQRSFKRAVLLHQGLNNVLVIIREHATSPVD